MTIVRPCLYAHDRSTPFLMDTSEDGDTNQSDGVEYSHQRGPTMSQLSNLGPILPGDTFKTVVPTFPILKSLRVESL
jgi:hypothetical protein